MSNEREKPGKTTESDERVSTVYRDLANEYAPDHLTRRILRDAANAAKSPYAKSMRWTRPVAWAATIAVCLAITLQVTRDPSTDQMTQAPFRADNEQALSPASEPLAPTATPVPGTATETGRNRDAFDAATPPPATTADLASKVTVDAGLDEDLAEETIPASSMEFAKQDQYLLRHAENAARLHSGDNKDIAEAEKRSLALLASAAALPADGCDDEAKSTAETWYACVERLEDAGHHEMAKEQRKQLAEAFPDFEAP